MNHTAYEEAKKKLAILLKDVDKIERFLVSYREIYPEVESRKHKNPLKTHQIHEEFVNHQESEQITNILGHRAINLSTNDSETQQNTSTEQVIQLAIQILKERGLPLHRGQLLQALIDKGAVINGKDPAKVLGTTLWRSGKFESIEGSGYWPKGLPKRGPYWDLL